MPEALNQFVITQQLPARIVSDPVSATATARSMQSLKDDLCSLHNGVVDRVVSEIEARFCTKNVALLDTLKVLASFDDTFFSIEKLKPLGKLCTVDMESRLVCHEIECARDF